MPPTPSPQNPVVFIDQEHQKYLQTIASHTAQAIDEPVQLVDITPVFDKHPLENIPLEEVEDEETEKDTLVSTILPILQKTVRVAPAQTFLSKKMEWLKRKHGTEVTLK